MEKLITELNRKLKALSFRTKKTDEITAKGDKEALERHQASIANITQAVSAKKEGIEEKKFSKEESEEEVPEWGAPAEKLLAEADESTQKIAKHLKSMIAAAQDAEALEAHTKAMEYEKLLMEQKLNQEQTAAAKRIVDKHSKEVETPRFTRVLFGLAPSPFLLGGVIQQHLETWKTRLPESVSEVLKSLYVDDLITGAPTIPAAKQLKCEATEIFADAKFELHKWHSNEPELESSCENYKPTFAKQQLGSTSTPGKGKLLGVPWDKSKDTIGVTFPNSPAELTKRGVLTNLAKVYDPLGLASPVMLDGK